MASKLREKNNADYIVANDFSKIGNGKHWTMILNQDGFVTEYNTKKEIAKALEKPIFLLKEIKLGNVLHCNAFPNLHMVLNILNRLRHFFKR